MSDLGRPSCPTDLLWPRRYLFVFPHPDDEIFSCLALLRRIADAGLATRVDAVWLTRGWPEPEAFTRPDDYWLYRRALDAEHDLVRRRLEQGLLSATYVMDIASRTLHTCAGHAERGLEQLISENRYDALFTCPLEGAHPDHDMTNVLCGAAARTSGLEGRVWEYTSYHLAPDERLRNNEFLFPGGSELCVQIKQDDIYIKEDLRQVYRSEPSLADFETSDERFRLLSWPPDLGAYMRTPTLYYETWNSGVRRADVGTAIRQWL